tara:strand:- start:1583 stop:2065 length:483 start_codon:yes stop_codon:yes gene_type:complete
MAKNLTGDDLSFIEALTKVLKKNNLSELEISRDYGNDQSLTVRLSQQMKSHQNIVNSQSNISPEPTPLNLQDKSMVPEDPALNIGAVTSPMVGTCFLQSEPGSDPFVSVGKNVIEGQTLLIIEAMKTMNHIPAPKSGIIKRILIEDGTPVEFGAPLMIIE